jgi:hypothetical protein
VSDSEKRVIVDGIDLAEVLRFPRILLGVTSAMQPGRLVVGLIMVTALMTAGRLWDAVAEPSVSPRGLMAGRATEEDLAAAQQALREAVSLYGSDEMRATLGQADAAPLSIRAVVDDIRKVHRERMASPDATDPAWRERDTESRLAMLRGLDTRRPRGAFEASVVHIANCFNSMIRGVIHVDIREFRLGARILLIRTPEAIWTDQRGFAFLYGIVLLLVVSIGGGAIARMEACQRAGRERLRVRDAFEFALGSWWNLVFALVLPLLLAGLAALVIMLLGLLMRLPWVLDLLGAAAYAVALVIAGLLAFLLLGYALGFSLLIPAVACENCDAADAQQRSFAYVLNRPLHRVFYGFVSVIGLSVGFAVVSLFAATMLNSADALFSAWSGGHPALSGGGGFALFDLGRDDAISLQPSRGDLWASGLIGFWKTIVLCLVAAYAFSYYYGASTIVYLLLRRASDGQDEQEIWRPGMAPGTLTPLPDPIVPEES